MGLYFRKSFGIGPFRINMSKSGLSYSFGIGGVGVNISNRGSRRKVSYAGIQSKWYDKTWIVILLCIIFFPVGIYGLWKNESIPMIWKIGITLLISLIALTQIGKDKVDSPIVEKSLSKTFLPSDPGKFVNIGEVLKTDHFEVTVNSVKIEDSVNTGDEFRNLDPIKGKLYLIINTSFKNISNESEKPYYLKPQITAGSVWIENNGKKYEFDKDVDFGGDTRFSNNKGWGLWFYSLNPLQSEITNLVYKIPSEIKGDVYWVPTCADIDQKILLGSLLK